MLETTVYNLFPTPVWVVDLEPEIYEGLNADILHCLDDLSTDRPPVPIGGTLQTDTNLHKFDEFASLTDRILEGTEAVLKFLEVEYSNFEITGCWANINPVGGLNTPHTHPNNYLSGVYYVQTMEGADSIFFSDPRPQAIVVRPPFGKDNAYTGNEVSMEAKEGRLIIFPAWLSHGVPPNRGNRDRISISFNIMFSDYTAEMSKPLWSPSLKLKSRSER
jgi:uncharacterized protein (TIGR02466 family)